MDRSKLSYKISPDLSKHFPERVRDFIRKEKHTKLLYNRYPEKEQFFLQAEEKLKTYRHRELLTETLSKQTERLEIAPKQADNLKLFRKENTVCVCTGHQLNLMLSPLYCVYKILHIIRLCEELNAEKLDFHFVPLFWLASEDHDLEETNHFFHRKEKWQWLTEQEGAVGRMNLEGLLPHLETFIKMKTKRTQEGLLSLIQEAYCEDLSWAEGQRKLLNSLFGDKGLLILDADDPKLKESMIPAFQRDLTDNLLYQKVNDTIEPWSKKSIQVNPREINLFYLEQRSRKRIVKKNEGLQIDEESKFFSLDEMLRELEKSPEKFSPNVLMRPLYQETILPNVAYVGGGSEINYWLQLLSFFKAEEMPFPILVPRNSFTILPEKWDIKREKLNLDWEDIFIPEIELEKKWVQKNTKLNIDFNEHQSRVDEVYLSILKEAEKTDASLKNLVLARKKQQEKAFKQMRKRLLNAERRVFKEDLLRVQRLREEFFPESKWQERRMGFVEASEDFGSHWLEGAYLNIDPFSFDFTIFFSE